MPDTTFDNALETIVAAVEATSLDLTGCEVTLLRDLTGRVRLHLARPENHPLPTDAKATLKAALAAAVPYATEIVYLDVLGQSSRDFPLADRLRAERRRLDIPRASSGRSPTWYRFDRRFSKDSWLQETGQTQEPWSFEEGSPVVISFYGFKGGV